MHAVVMVFILALSQGPPIPDCYETAQDTLTQSEAANASAEEVVGLDVVTDSGTPVTGGMPEILKTTDDDDVTS